VKVKEAGKEYAFLLNQCPPAQQNARVEQGAKALQAMGGLLAPMVSSRVDYQEAARQGLAVSELHPSGNRGRRDAGIVEFGEAPLKKDAAGKAEAKPAAKAEPKKPVKAEAPRAKAEPAKASAKSARKAA